MDEKELKKKILEKALQPEEYGLDGESVKNRSISDLIALDEHLTKKRSAKNPFAALKIARISTQGPER